MTVETLALERVVRTTEKPDVLHRALAAHAVRHHVIELDERPLVAASSVRAHEGASTAVAD